ncbi:hypothetical protein AVEN_91809-1 [Araneus ventricosus]|uniref:Uncharacterized protein n=1 Tax=Araneus ventricosus TaxID=182803 RepID=A0A4Y2I6F9_ARAVE|nr:hypothetical protein AVEN_25799-1 [Araneus ventricosus]GBM72849.1 hypothetical protein AVEN_91809-1 [Araneus ventricosus]
MYDATVSHVFSISLIAPEDCCFVVTSHSSDKLSSITSCCEPQCNSISYSVVSSWLCSSTSSSISFLSNSSLLTLAKDTISLTPIPQCHIRQHSPTKASSKQK